MSLFESISHRKLWKETRQDKEWPCILCSWKLVSWREIVQKRTMFKQDDREGWIEKGVSASDTPTLVGCSHLSHHIFIT